MMSSPVEDNFQLRVNLGDDGGIVQHSLPPFFSASALVTVRVPIPFDLDAEPIQGAWTVVKDGNGAPRAE